MPLLSQARFITVEGGEGVGKSIFTQGLTALLEQRGATVVKTREPGGTAVADQIRALFASPPAAEALTMQAEACLVSAGRAQHLEHVIRPALRRKSWVVSDRFADSTRVYQGILGGLEPEALEALIAFSTSGTEPDVTFLLDCPVAVSLGRLRRRPPATGVVGTDAVERYDQVAPEAHERLRQGFLQLLAQAPQRIIRLDASQSPSQVLAAAWSALEARYG